MATAFKLWGVRCGGNCDRGKNIFFLGGSAGGEGQLRTLSECTIPQINPTHCFQLFNDRRNITLRK